MKLNVPYLSMEIARTTIKGAQAVAGLKGLIWGIVCKIAIIRKYTLAKRLNCKIKASSC